MHDHSQKGSLTRRRFLMVSAATAGLANVPMSLHAKPADFPPLDQYTPVYFTPEEWAFILAATARLIPSDGDGPGAIETRVPLFLDQQLAGDYGKAVDWYMEGPHDPAAAPQLGYQTPYNPAQLYREGIKAFDAWCVTEHGALFAKLTTEQQDAALLALQDNKMGLEPELRDFFTLLLGNTKEGYFADPMYGGNYGMQAWSYIGFPGARASFKEWADQYNVRYPLGPVSISGERA
ncbi:gluconate 2-dehydrogenase subunit 3 family protein [Paenalcaligenes sp. Me131]|uniref:gluconate 2-dehydrogenase subunit 3 family protein n=1 Tax=Paenalcaligenes sp. Me131 TaxID=3392636 RepID=UPI003D26E2C9